MSLRDTFESLDTSLQLVAAVAVVIVGLFVVAAAVGGVAVVGSFVLGSGDGDVATAPEAAFSADPVEDGLTVTYEDGDGVEAANLLVVVDGTERSWADLTGQSGTLAPGDSLTVDADPGTQVELVYEGDAGRQTLGVFEA